MPTPSEHAAQLSLPTLSHSERATHGICPPDHAVSRIADDAPPDPDINNGNGSPRRRHDDPQQPAELGNSTPMETTSDTENNNTSPASVKMPTLDEVEGYFSSSSGEFYEESSRESSMSVEEDRAHGTEQHQSTMTSSLQQQNTSSSCSTEVNDGVPNIRIIPLITSSFLRPGSKFRGQQQSDKQIYQVEVEIKYVDMAESTLCGYLKIEGLTPDHPNLTTYFDAEIIGPKYTFQTRHPGWGATDKTDMHHWARFRAWQPLAKQAKRPDFHYKNHLQREHIFMRWKESFLVPDHRVREIMGASFEGFYYIVFNQITGAIEGIYFHAKSEKYQKLELRHVQDRGCVPAVEFR